VRAREITLGGLVGWLVLGGGLADAQEESARLRAVLAVAAPCIVTVRVVTKTQMEFGGKSQDREARGELHGVVVDPDGLIMLSNAAFSPEHLMGMVSGMRGADAPHIKTIPTDIKVVVEQEEKEYSAFLAATDSKLDLAFVQIEELAGRKLKAIDFSVALSPVVGQEVVAVSRLKRGYDSVPFFQVARISSELSKPRKAWGMDGGISEYGLPVFALSGEALGAVTTIESSGKDEAREDEMGFGMMMRMLSGGGGLIQPFLVPGPVVNGLITQARQQAATKMAERAKEKAEKPQGQ
jgi:hypothetical protein